MAAVDEATGDEAMGEESSGDEEPPTSDYQAPTPAAVAEAGRRKGRTSMPSWDEIVFGARSDD